MARSHKYVIFRRFTNNFYNFARVQKSIKSIIQKCHFKHSQQHSTNPEQHKNFINGSLQLHPVPSSTCGCCGSN